MAIIWKVFKLDNFKSCNSLELTSEIFVAFIWILLNADIQTFLRFNSPEILTLYETNLDDSIDSSF